MELWSGKAAGKFEARSAQIQTFLRLFPDTEMRETSIYTIILYTVCHVLVPHASRRPARFPGYSSLAGREKEILEFNQVSYPHPTAQVIDVSQSITRTRLSAMASLVFRSGADIVL